MTTSHADMKLKDYVRTIIPELKPDIRKYYHRELTQAVDQFCDLLGEDIAVADVTPAMLAEFAEGADRKWIVQRLRTVMRTFAPAAFRVRSAGGRRPAELNRGNGSDFLLVNVYLGHYEPTALRSRRPNTKRLYRTTLLMFDRFLNRSATLDDLNDETVAKFAAWRLSRGLSKRSVNKDLFNLLALWRWCNRKGFCESWPDVPLEKPPIRVPVAWTESEMRMLYQAVRLLPGRVGKLRACDWWAALLLVAWDSGERIGAIMSLEWEHVDLESRWIRFDAEHRKGGRDDSPVCLGDDAVKALRAIRANSGPVFPWPYCKTYLWTVFGRILLDAGMPAGAKSKFHRIRKTVASYAEAAGANATQMLRHSKREVTEAYLDPRIVKTQQPSDVLFRLA